MLKNKMKKLICGMTMCITVCSQMIFPQTAFAATKAAVEKAGECICSWDDRDCRGRGGTF